MRLRNPFTFFGWYALSVCAAIIAAVWMCCGCAANPLATVAPDAVDEHRIDSAWHEVCACWGLDPAVTLRPTVRIGEVIGVDENGLQLLDGAAVGYAEVYGYVGGGHSVIVAPDMSALAHEFSHWGSWEKRKWFGEHGTHGCFGVE